MFRFAVVWFAVVSVANGAANKPNVMIIIGDDATYSDLPMHGGVNVKTPSLDAFVKQGMQFTHAYVSMSMCNPCRTAMYTGLYPNRNGAAWNHSAARPGTKSIVHYLGDLGYRVGLTGKKHVVPHNSFPFVNVKGYEPGCVKDTADHDVAGVKSFIAESSQPFCLVVALVTPHVPWTVGDPNHFNPRTLQLPPHLADTPTTRENFATYLAEIEVMDQQVGDTLAALDASGKADDTLVLFTSEQGAQFPGCKWTCWETGLHTAMSVRWPGVVKPGSQTNAIVMYEDYLPTLIEIAGGDAASKKLDGTSFLNVLTGKLQTHREYAYGMHNNIPEGPSYPIRSVRDRRFRYIRNLKPDAIYIERHLMGVEFHNPYWATWMHASPFNEKASRLISRYMHRPPEELYLTSDDPSEMTNLANDPRYTDVKSRLSTELDRWMSEQNDPGAELDTKTAWNARREAAGLNKKRK